MSNTNCDELINTLFLCYSKNLTWEKPTNKHDLRKTVLQRETCHYLSRILSKK
jgi:hypothetical protein